MSAKAIGKGDKINVKSKQITLNVRKRNATKQAKIKEELSEKVSIKHEAAETTYKMIMQDFADDFGDDFEESLKENEEPQAQEIVSAQETDCVEQPVLTTQDKDNVTLINEASEKRNVAKPSTSRKDESINKTQILKPIDPKYAVLAALGLAPVTPLLARLGNVLKDRILASQVIEQQGKDSKLQCHECSKFFRTKSQLQSHYLDDHNSVMKFSCKICSRLFPSRTQMLKHRASHGGDKPYSCTVCTFQFVSLEALTAHVRRHQGKLPYLCRHCDEGFQYYHEFKTHKLVHKLKKEGDSEALKQIPCTICEKKFRKNCDLIRHLRVHTGEKPFACSVCGNRFQQAHNLNKHMFIHTKERQYECELCSKVFWRIDVLNRHMFTHAIHKPFPCEFCSRSFIRKQQIIAHMKKKHDIKDAELLVSDFQPVNTIAEFEEQARMNNLLSSEVPVIPDASTNIVCDLVNIDLVENDESANQLNDCVQSAEMELAPESNSITCIKKEYTTKSSVTTLSHTNQIQIKLEVGMEDEKKSPKRRSLRLRLRDRVKHLANERTPQTVS